mmetsp:Transcript_25863/g.12220  ORF Transcript_25863/g.12220 Transcript_25863/m.12220 type:complete len:94 (+) Transcript_25863:286-567(+)
MSLGPLIFYALEVDPSILVTALLATSVIFVCFTLAALMSARRSYIFLGGICGSILFGMTLFSLAKLLFGYRQVGNFELVLGLLVFCGYVLYDT